MKKFSYILLVIVLIFGSFFVVAKVDAQSSSSGEELIQNFISNISVNLDNSVDVVENITYNTGPQQRHGIYRDIYPFSSAGKKMAISSISVTNENNLPFIFTVSNSGKNIRIKIGDLNQTFTGSKSYIVKYHATRAVAQLKDIDEIYWNVTGNEWTMPIHQAQASVVLPSGVKSIQSACYFGPKGSVNKCGTADYLVNHFYVFNAPSKLNSGEGLTVAVGFPKGIVAPYSNSTSDKISDFFNLYLSWFIAGLLPILTLLFSLWYWYKKGRDPKGTGVIVPQYDVPDGLTPMEVIGIVKEKVRPDNISAEIIYLATQGYLKITQLESKTLGIFKSTDYELAKLKDSSSLPNLFDKTLLGGLFALNANSVKLSSLEKKFYMTAKQIIFFILESLLSKGYYKNLGRMKDANPVKIGIAVLVFVFVAKAIRFFNLEDNFALILFSILISIIIGVIIYHFSPAKTEKGVATKEYILGLKDYLQIAEKDRLLFHNAPEKKPETFEKLLPYAMVLGVANIWVKEFEGIYTTPPSWYYGPNNGAFNAIIFTHSLSSFNSFASSSLGSTPGGSGGGGFSGGGGGGGGGGGW